MGLPERQVEKRTYKVDEGLVFEGVVESDDIVMDKAFMYLYFL